MLSLLLLLLGPVQVATLPAQEPDFYVVMQKCSTTVGYLVLSEDSLKTVEGTPATNACTRRGKSIACEIAFADKDRGLKGNSVQYAVTLDSPPLLMFGDEHAGDLFVIDTAQHAAVVITRVVDKQYAGAKVCQGLFATQSEMETLRRK